MPRPFYSPNHYNTKQYIVSIKGERRYGHAIFDRKREAIALCTKLAKAGISYKLSVK